MSEFADLFDPNKPHDHCHLCVEMSGNHQNALDGALDFIEAAHCAGADSIKLQAYTPDTITFNSDRPDFRLPSDNDWSAYGTFYQLYEKAHTPWEWFPPMFAKAREFGIPIFASPFDPTAIDMLEDLGVPAYKIASPEVTDVGLIEKAAKTGKPVIVSTGLASEADLDLAVSVLRKHDAPFMILKCTTAYPTPPEDVNLRSIPWLAERYGCTAGLSDHTIGIEAGLAACALGGRLIEKHCKLPGDESSVDAAFSMPLDQLPGFRASLAAVIAALGEATLEMPEIAKPSLNGRRSLYVVAPIKAGEIFTHDNVRSIRPTYGLHPKFLSEILGKRAVRDIEPGERMALSLIADETAD